MGCGRGAGGGRPGGRRRERDRPGSAGESERHLFAETKRAGTREGFHCRSPGLGYEAAEAGRPAPDGPLHRGTDRGRHGERERIPAPGRGPARGPVVRGASEFFQVPLQRQDLLLPAGWPRRASPEGWTPSLSESLSGGGN